MSEPTAGLHVWMVNHHAVIPSKDGAEGRHVMLAEHLESRGWSTSLLVASTAHPSGRQMLRAPRLRRIERLPGVRIVWLRANAYGSSMPLRLLGMLGFSAHALLPGALRGLPRPDVVIGSTVHPFAAIAGLALARRHGVPFVFEVRDVWPDYLIDLGRLRTDAALATVLRAVMAKAASEAALVISPLRHVDDWLRDIGLPETPFVWISNGVDRRHDVEPTASPATTSADDSTTTFMYLGAHGPANALDHLLEAFDTAVRLAPELDLRLRLVGEGPSKPELERLAASLPAHARITFEERIPRSEVIHCARSADVLVATMGAQPVYRYGISPNKLFDYLLAARPIVLSSDQRNPVGDADAGIVVPSDDPDALADALLRMARTPAAERDAMGARGRAHVMATYQYDALAEQLDASLRQVVGARQAVRA